MADNQSSRYQLPFLAVGQAQKEITHNEAVVLIDALLHASVESELQAPPVSDAVADSGKSWIIGIASTGDWVGRDGQIAHWAGGSWRYMVPQNGMRVWNRALQSEFLFVNGQWKFNAAIPDPNGGSNVDLEARSAIVSILEILRSTGTIVA